MNPHTLTLPPRRALAAALLSTACIAVVVGPTPIANAAPFASPVGLQRPSPTNTTPDIAFAANGTATAVWVSIDSYGHERIYAATRGKSSASWSAAQAVSPRYATFHSNSSDAASPTLAVAADGSAVVTWLDRNRRAWMQRRAAGTRSWSAPVRLSPTGRVLTEKPVVGADKAGRFTIAFVTTMPGAPATPVINVDTVSRTGSVARATVSGPGAFGSAQHLTLGVSSAGLVGIGWLQAEQFVTQVRVATRAPGHGWAVSVIASITDDGIDKGASEVSTNVTVPAVAVSASGAVGVTWVRNRMTARTIGQNIFAHDVVRSRVYTSFRRAAGWSTAAAISSASVLSDTPRLAMSGDGSAVVAWVTSRIPTASELTTNASRTWRVTVATRRAAGAGWKLATAGGPTSRNLQPSVVLAADAHGHAILAYTSEPSGVPGADDLSTSTVNAHTGAQSARTVAHATQPAVAVAANGTTVVGWAAGNSLHPSRILIAKG